MAVSEKSAVLKKNKCVHLAAITAGLAFGNVSAEDKGVEEFSPTAKFFAAENRNYSIDCDLVENFLEGRRIRGG